MDIGCGLGELLRHITANKKVGMDMCEDVILAARELDDGMATYKVGSFD
ncbi:class I SAM-dependent methyltransferase [Parablautia muri]|nr:hypothetical protein [Parablautia muri]